MRSVTRAMCLAVGALIVAATVIGAPADPGRLMSEPALASDAGLVQTGRGAEVRSVAEAPLMAPTVTSLPVTADTYVRDILENTNEGASTFLRITNLGNNRALVRFDQAAIQSTMAGGTLVSAKLRLTLIDTNNLWGPSGRDVGVHRLTKTWNEGNGFVSENGSPNRGTGSGATYECAIDSNIANHVQDCGGATAWNMDNAAQWPFVSTPIDTKTIVNGQTGAIEWDVTADVAAFNSGSATNFGWIVKKVNESQTGTAKLASGQNGTVAARPVLVLSVNPAVTNTPTPTVTNTPTSTLTQTPTSTSTLTPTVTETPTATSTSTSTPIPTPVANPDLYSATGNVSISVPAGSGVLVNDTPSGGSVTSFGPATGAETAAGGTGTTSAGGTLVVNGDGSFAFDPPAGFNGNAVFKYTLTVGSQTAVGTVTISVADMIWFIDNNAGACTSACDGRLSHPFTTLAAFQAVNGGVTPNPQPGHTVFLYESSADYVGPVTLRDGQRLAGQDASTSLLTISGITLAPFSPSLPAMNVANATRTRITGATTGITLGASNQIHGLTVANTTGTAVGSPVNVGTLLLRDLNVANASSAGAGIILTTGGTVTASGTNTSATGAATALQVEDTTIGSGGLLFQSISSNGGSAPGIVLDTTGSSGGLTVAGAGAAASGGTIQNKTGDGISLTATQAVSLNWMAIDNNDGSGVFGDNVNGFAIVNSTVTNNADTATGTEAGLRFNNLLGASGIVSTTFQGQHEDHVRVTNSSGVLSDLAVSNSTFNVNSAATGGHAISVFGTNTAALTVNVTGTTFDDTRSSGLLVSLTDTAAGTVNVSTSQFRDSGAAVTLQTNLSADLTFNITNNTEVVRSISNAIQVVASATSTSASEIRGTITGNAIGNGTPDSGSRDQFGIALDLRGDQDSIITVDGNTVQNTDFEGVWITSADFGTNPAQNGTMDLRLRDNAIGTPDDNGAFPLGAVRGALIDVRHTTVACVDMASNTSASVGGLEHFRLRQRETSTFRLERLDDGDAAPAETINSTATVEAHIAAQNDPGSTADATLVAGFIETAHGACRTP